MPDVESFNAHRRHLLSIAYNMLGSAVEAEDIVQEAYLRWRDAGDSVEHPKAWLSTVVTRLCIDHLRSARVKREEYVGPWLPEPVVSGEEPAAERAVSIAHTLSMAFLVLLETLSPVERAVFLMCEVFDYSHAEVAQILGKSEAGCRQVLHRARERVASRRPRFDAPADESGRLARQFMQTCATGDLEGMLGLLAEDVTLYSDGGGKTRAALNPIYGADRVSRFIFGLLSKAPEGFSASPTAVNGVPGAVCYVGGAPLNVLTFDIVDGRIGAIYIVVNPEKLTRVPRLGG